MALGMLSLVPPRSKFESRPTPLASSSTGNHDSFPRPPAPDYLKAADANPDVGEVLDLLGKGVVVLGWFDLYKVYEIIRANVGNEAALRAKNWVPASDLKAFTASANLPAVSGAAARHARASTGAPKQIMDLRQARTMINLLVVAWLKSL
jgi:hypothetical protein